MAVTKVEAIGNQLPSRIILPRCLPGVTQTSSASYNPTEAPHPLPALKKRPKNTSFNLIEQKNKDNDHQRCCKYDCGARHPTGSLPLYLAAGEHLLVSKPKGSSCWRSMPRLRRSTEIVLRLFNEQDL